MQTSNHGPYALRRKDLRKVGAGGWWGIPHPRRVLVGFRLGRAPSRASRYRVVPPPWR